MHRPRGVRSLLPAAVGATVLCLLADHVAAQPTPAAPPKAAEQRGGEAKVIPGTGVVIGKETTWITGPLAKDGSIDYLQAMNDRIARGVTPANNAAVPFWHVMGAGDAHLDEAVREALFERLGAEPPPASAPSWRTLEGFIEAERQAGRPIPHAEELSDQLYAAAKAPWKSAERPALAAWIEANGASVEKIVEGLSRPRFYSPLLMPADSESGTLIEVRLPHSQASREVARLLIARAMLRAGSGQLEQAWSDIHAAHRLSRHLAAASVTLVEGLVSLAIADMAFTAEVQLAQLPLTRPLLNKVQEQRAALGPLPSVERIIDQGERFMMLDVIQSLALQKSQIEELTGVRDPVVQTLLSKAIDWNEPMRMANQQYDRLVAMVRLPTHAQRVEAQRQWEEDMKKLARPSKLQIAAALLGGDTDKVLGRELGKILVSLLLPATHQAHVAELRLATRSDLVDLAYALASYRLERGEYPQRLEQLAPVHLKTLPSDRFTGEPFVYRREAEGYWLYSLGPNMRDDEGKGPYTEGGEGADRGEQDDIGVHEAL